MAIQDGGFIFDGIHSREYELMVYEIGNHKQSPASLTSTGTLETDSLAYRNSILLYGAKKDNPLTFNFVFGTLPKNVASHITLDKDDISVISAWLTGYNEYKWLSFDQDDMANYRYRCLITDLKPIDYGLETYAFSCTVTCDSPYAYMKPYVEKIPLSGVAETFRINNRSTMNDDYYPKIEIDLHSSSEIIIENKSTGDTFAFEVLPVSQPTTIYIDNENEVIESDLEANLYDFFNFSFFSLRRGINELSVVGDGELRIIYEFPVNIGG